MTEPIVTHDDRTIRVSAADLTPAEADDLARDLQDAACEVRGAISRARAAEEDAAWLAATEGMTRDGWYAAAWDPETGVLRYSSRRSGYGPSIVLPEPATVRQHGGVVAHQIASHGTGYDRCIHCGASMWRPVGLPRATTPKRCAAWRRKETT